LGDLFKIYTQTEASSDIKNPRLAMPPSSGMIFNYLNFLQTFESAFIILAFSFLLYY